VKEEARTKGVFKWGNDGTERQGKTQSSLIGNVFMEEGYNFYEMKCSNIGINFVEWLRVYKAKVFQRSQRSQLPYYLLLFVRDVNTKESNKM